MKFDIVTVIPLTGCRLARAHLLIVVLWTLVITYLYKFGNISIQENMKEI